MPFLSPLRTEWVAFRRGFARHRLTEPLVYRVCRRGLDLEVEVPAGWLTDFASVPWWGRGLFPADADYTRAAVVHDYLCETRGVDQFLADAVFRVAMKDLGVPAWRRLLMYYAVRLFQFFHGRY
jgi:hypothetical protein